jgi:hypothetical protein
MHAHAADAVAAARKKWEFGVDEDDAIEQAQWEEKVQAARREAYRHAIQIAGDSSGPLEISVRLLGAMENAAEEGSDE